MIPKFDADPSPQPLGHGLLTDRLDGGRASCRASLVHDAAYFSWQIWNHVTLSNPESGHQRGEFTCFSDDPCLGEVPHEANSCCVLPLPCLREAMSRGRLKLPRSLLQVVTPAKAPSKAHKVKHGAVE